ncbi:MAG: BatD family protein, partial [Planctomycetes bacterium]|nr:BatD family protein [Planctomycetota bacterium]
LTLRMTADKDECFVGEPVTLTIQWHIEFDLQNVKAVDMRLPVLHDERFDVFEPHSPLAIDDKNAIGLPVSDTRIISNGQSQTVDGRNITTLTFSRIIIPKQPGPLDLPPATVICAVILAPAKARRQWNQYPSYFDNDFFEKDIDAEYQRLFTKSDGLTLKVKPLPSDDRPQDFDGLVCSGCDISVTAEPTTVSVGAPVTVTIRLSTASGIEHIDLPPLGEQPALANDFEIPGQRSPAVMKDNAKIFTQSIRPLRTDVDEIAAIELTCFDPATGKYATAASQPIPIVVNEAVAVTDLSDGQGPAADQLQNRPESLFSGLMHNYEDEDILKNAGACIFGLGGKILWIFILILPPLIYAKLAITSAIIKARQIDPKARRHKAA